jgi:recombination protein RecA
VAEFDIMYNEGISKAGDILDIAVETGIVEKRGSFYSYGETRLGQGRENAKNFLRENSGLSDEVEILVRQTSGLRLPTFGDPDDESPSEDDSAPLELELVEAAA